MFGWRDVVVWMQPTIFADLAQESLNLCRLSLVSASEVIKSQSQSQTQTHSHSKSQSSTAKSHTKSQSSQATLPPPPPTSPPTRPSAENPSGAGGETQTRLGKELDAVLFLVRHLLILKEMARGLEGLMRSLETEGAGAGGMGSKSGGGGGAYGYGSASGMVGDVAGGGGGVTGAFLHREFRPVLMHYGRMDG